MEYKFLHVFWFNSEYFIKSLMNFFSDNKNLLFYNDTIFVTPHKELYEKIKCYDNVFYCNKREIMNLVKKSKWVFFHSMGLSKKEVVMLPKKICNKILWRTWGHDCRPLSSKNILRNILFYFYKKKVKQFKAIGIANEIDAVNISNIFGADITFKIMGYDNFNSNKNYELSKLIESKFDNKIRILLGHNAGVAENHIINLERLSHYRNEDIEIIIPFSYGGTELYKNQVVEASSGLFSKGKVKFIYDKMDFIDFAKLISSIDVAIMDQEYSNGLGTLALLVFYKKKIYVNKNGNCCYSFLKNGILPNLTEDIGVLDFDSFKTNDYCELYDKYSYFSEDKTLNEWIELVNELK